MNPQLQNWQNFCQYHAGNWHGTWTRYSPSGKVIEFFQCIRSFQLQENGRKIEHQNHYTYVDGKKETKTFGPYKKPITTALFLDHSFSWGSRQVELETRFFFETGFRYQDRRASLGVSYNERREIERITVISEHLESWAEISSLPPLAQEICQGWQGKAQNITPDYIVSSPVATSWKRLEDLEEDYLTLHLNDGISVSFPQQLEPRKEFFLATDWLINSRIMPRGLRYFDSSGFTHFTLEVFTSNT